MNHHKSPEIVINHQKSPETTINLHQSMATVGRFQGLGEPLLNSDLVAVHEAMDALNRPDVRCWEVTKDRD